MYYLKFCVTRWIHWANLASLVYFLEITVYNATTFKANYLYTHIQNIRAKHQGNIKGKVREST